MSNTDTKIAIFEYAMYQFINWYGEVVSKDINHITHHFTRLTALKLLFLLASVKDESNQNRDLLEYFDNFCAMQYGPVERDIYSAIVTHRTTFYSFGNRQMNILNDAPQFNHISESNRNKVNAAINQLKSHNKALISYHSSRLVEITHKWESWRNAMSIACWLGKGSESMSTESIRNSIPYYV